MQRNLVLRPAKAGVGGAMLGLISWGCIQVFLSALPHLPSGAETGYHLWKLCRNRPCGLFSRRFAPPGGGVKCSTRRAVPRGFRPHRPKPGHTAPGGIAPCRRRALPTGRGGKKGWHPGAGIYSAAPQRRNRLWPATVRRPLVLKTGTKPQPCTGGTFFSGKNRRNGRKSGF